MQVLVIGGGIGGLALAAGLRRHGVDVTVYERDVDLTATGGYHITLDPRAQEALADLVGPMVMRRLLASSAAVDHRDADVMWDWKGRLVARLPGVVADGSIDVDRITLRLLLADAVGADLQRGRSFTRFERRGDERVVAHFADGAPAYGDVLVAADGAHSPTARQLAGRPTNAPTGLVGISGRTQIASLSATERRRLGVRSSFAVGPRGTALYVGYLDPVGHAALDEPSLRSSVTTEPTYIWGAMVPDDDRSRPLRGLRGAPLRDATLQLLARRGWSRPALEVVERTEEDSVARYRFHAAPTDPEQLAPWAAGSVTALGDAIHATPPTAGMGAGVAIRDAEHLVRALLEVRDGRRLPEAVHEFERAAAERGAEAVTLAMKTVRQVLATDSLLGTAGVRTVLPAMATVAALRGRLRRPAPA